MEKKEGAAQNESSSNKNPSNNDKAAAILWGHITQEQVRIKGSKR
jgi:hypothetical protein